MAGQLGPSGRRPTAARRVLVYGLGTGRGHATRTGALCLELAQLGAEVRLLIGAGTLGIVRALGVEAAVVCEAGDAPERAWSRALREFEPTDCVVDSFPEGLYDELRSTERPEARWVALLRCRRDTLSPAFVAGLAGYTEVLDLEPGLGWAPREARPFGSVVRRLAPGASQTATDVLLVATETRQRPFLEKLWGHLERAGVRTTCVPAPGVARAEAALLTRDLYSAKVVIGPAGYNLTYELSALGVWHLALPAARQYDDQELRAERVAVVAHSPLAVERRVHAWLDQGVSRPPGAVRAMRELAQLLLG